MATRGKKKPVKKPSIFVWLRSGLRSMSRRHAPIYQALADAKVAYKGVPSDADYNPRQRFAYTCAICHNEFPAKGVAVDHRIDCGSLLCWDDVTSFMQRLFCGEEGLDVLCHPCHDAKSLASKNGITFEEAVQAKRVIEFMKDKKEVLALCAKHGYHGVEVSNEIKRKALVSKILKENASV